MQTPCPCSHASKVCKKCAEQKHRCGLALALVYMHAESYVQTAVQHPLVVLDISGMAERAAIILLALCEALCAAREGDCSVAFPKDVTLCGCCLACRAAVPRQGHQQLAMVRRSTLSCRAMRVVSVRLKPTQPASHGTCPEIVLLRMLQCYTRHGPAQAMAGHPLQRGVTKAQSVCIVYV